MSTHHPRARLWAAALSSTALATSLVAAGALGGGSAAADSASTDFESFAAGTPNGQQGWTSTGPYDREIVNSYPGAPASFGGQSLRMSNAVTSGSFGDQTFSASLADEAGEAGAANGGLSGGTRQRHFEAEWDFASAQPGAEQPGLSVVASPDRGDGARMGWIQMADTPGGLEVNFFDYRDEHPVGEPGNLKPGGCSNNGASNPANGDGFFSTTVASGLSRADVHTIKVTMDFLQGPRNDVVRVYVDGVLRHVGTSWEDYFRYCEETNTSRTVDSILFRTSGGAAPATVGNGFLVDNMTLASGPVVTSDSTGEWTLFPDQSKSSTTSTTTSTTYRSKVRPPINANGSSNFPARRGVIPVQFDLESATRTVVEKTTVTGPVVFESIGSDASADNDYSFLRFVPDQTVNFADVNELVADYTFAAGNCAGGSLRWSVRVDQNGDGVATNDDPSVFVYFGEMPNFTDCTGSESNSGMNLIGDSDARFDLQQLGGPYYGTYADALDLVGDIRVLRASLVLDSGWSQDQVVDLTGARVDGAVWSPMPEGSMTEVVSDTTTGYAPTCNLPDAKLRWAKSDPTPSGGINEAVSIQPNDSGQYYRKVDCKYIYNLDVSSLDSSLGSRPGTYRVWVNIDGANVADPAKFDLR